VTRLQDGGPRPLKRLIPGGEADRTPMAVGKLVTLEGIDASGKGTQAALLAEWARGAGLRVTQFAFPRYSGSFYGELVGRYLRGEFGEVGAQSPYLSALPYAGDRLEAAPALRDALHVKDLVVVDRYVGSNAAHQGAKLPFGALPQFADWIHRLEFEVHGIPQEDLVILLDLPVETAVGLRRGRSAAAASDPDAADIHERDTEYLSAVRVCYQWLAGNLGNWRVVHCAPGGALRPSEEIAADVRALVASLLGR